MDERISLVGNSFPCGSIAYLLGHLLVSTGHIAREPTYKMFQVLSAKTRSPPPPSGQGGSATAPPSGQE
eukprot:6665948-Heterocapsa_arctica.AAC.1